LVYEKKTTVHWGRGKKIQKKQDPGRKKEREVGRAYDLRKYRNDTTKGAYLTRKQKKEEITQGVGEKFRTIGVKGRISRSHGSPHREKKKGIGGKEQRSQRKEQKKSAEGSYKKRKGV